MWIEPITDRTNADVENDRHNADPDINLKGKFNISDLNRLSNNLEWIKDNIAMYKYPTPVIPPDWVITDFFTYKDINSYEKNIYYLKDLYSLSDMYPGIDFGSPEHFGDSGRKSLNYIKINQWERIMFYLYQLTVEGLATWRDVYDNFDTWRQVYDFFRNWGDMLKWNVL